MTQAFLDLKEQRVLLDHWERREKREMLDLRVPLKSKGQEETLESEDPWGRRENLEALDQLDLLGQLDHKGPVETLDT